jgi:hypothetical protein
MAKGRKTGGRRPGSQNKVTRTFKDMVVQCLQDIGGRPAFAAWATKNRTDFYKIAARLIPTELTTDGDKPLPLRVELTDAAPAPDAE